VFPYPRRAPPPPQRGRGPPAWVRTCVIKTKKRHIIAESLHAVNPMGGPASSAMPHPLARACIPVSPPLSDASDKPPAPVPHPFARAYASLGLKGEPPPRPRTLPPLPHPLAWACIPPPPSEASHSLLRQRLTPSLGGMPLSPRG